MMNNRHLSRRQWAAAATTATPDALPTLTPSSPQAQSAPSFRSDPDAHAIAALPDSSRPSVQASTVPDAVQPSVTNVTSIGPFQ